MMTHSLGQVKNTFWRDLIDNLVQLSRECYITGLNLLRANPKMSTTPRSMELLPSFWYSALYMWVCLAAFTALLHCQELLLDAWPPGPLGRECVLCELSFKISAVKFLDYLCKPILRIGSNLTKLMSKNTIWKFTVL